MCDEKMDSALRQKAAIARAKTNGPVYAVTRTCYFLLATLALLEIANAQRTIVPKDLINDLADEVVKQPLGPMREIALQDLVLTKVVTGKGEPTLIMMIEALRPGKQTVAVTRMEQRKQSRKVPGKDGNLVDQEFLVPVEITENVEMDIKVPAGRRPVEFPASEFEFYDLHGRNVELDQAAKQLSQLRPMFLLDATHGSPPEVPELYRQALREDCLIAVTAKLVRDRRSLPMMRLAPAVDVVAPRNVKP